MKFMLVAEAGTPDTLTVLADNIQAVDAGDAVNQAIAGGLVPLTDTQGGRFRVLPLDGAREYKLNLSIRELGASQ